MAQITMIVSVISIAAAAILGILLVLFILRLKKAGATRQSLLNEIKEGPSQNA